MKNNLHQITLREATIEDLAILEYWDQQQHVKDASGDDDIWNWSEELKYEPEWREQLIAELLGRPLGTVQIIDPAAEETHYWGEVAPNLRAIDIWIGEAADLGKGYGTIMMQLAIERSFDASEVTAIMIDPLFSNQRAIRFYQRLGFDEVERRMFENDDCLVMQLTREKWS
ncbi:MAG: GNAT family N-acetyltransferase [Saprospiraceae bacterium]